MSTDPEARRKRRVSDAEAAEILASRDPGLDMTAWHRALFDETSNTA